MGATVLVALVCAGSAVAAGPLFTAGPATALEPSAYPAAMVSADFNGDGYPDLATTDYNDGTVTILEGSAAGTFTVAPGSPIQLSSGVRPIASAEFGKDTFMDLAVGNQSDDTITILKGDGNGEFVPEPTALELPCAPDGIATGDFNGDTVQDLAVSEVCGQVQVFLGKASGGFAAPETITLPSVSGCAAGPGSIVADHFVTANQSLFDLVVLDETNAKLDVLIGKANGTFAAASGSPVATGETGGCANGLTLASADSLAEGDFNGDGNDDVAVGFPDGKASVLLGNGKGQFTIGPGSPAQIAPANTQILDLATGSFSGGKYSDLAAGDYWQGGGFGTAYFGDWVSVDLGGSTGALTPAAGSPYQLNGIAGPLATGAFADGLTNQKAGDDIVATDGEGASCKYYGVVTLIDDGPSGGVTPAGNKLSGDGCTIPAPDAVTDTSPSAVSLTSATIGGTVDPYGSPITSCRIEYGLSSPPTQSAPCTLPQYPLRGPQTVSAALTNLRGQSTYYYRVVASTAAGAGTGKTESFQTCAAPSVPASALPEDDKLDIKGCFSLKTVGKKGYTTTDYISYGGQVEVDGIDYAPDPGGTITIDPRAPELTATGSGTVKLGGLIPLSDWGRGGKSVKLSGQVTLINSSNAVLEGFPIVGSLTAGFDGDEATMTGSVSLNKLGPLANVNASVTIITDNATGIAGATIKLAGADEAPGHNELDPCDLDKRAPPGFSCASVTDEKGNTYAGLVPNDPSIIKIGPVEIEDFELSLDFADREWSGGGAISLASLLPGSKEGSGTPPAPPADEGAAADPLYAAADLLPHEGEPGGTGATGGEGSTGGESRARAFAGTLGVQVTFGWDPFRLVSIDASDSDLELKVGPATITEISLRYQQHPIGFGGSLGLTTYAGWAADGGFDFQTGEKSGFELTLHGMVTWSSQVSVGGFISVDDRDGAFEVALGGSYSKGFGPASVSASLSGGIGHTHGGGWGWELDGTGSATVFGYGINADAVISNVGAGICGQAQLPFGVSLQVGYEHFWSGNGGGWDSSCDFSGLHTIPALAGATAAAVGRSVQVPAGLAREEFAAVGADAPPDVTLTGPGGVTLTTPTTPDHLTASAAGVALADTGSRTTYLIVLHPRAGRWTIAPSGSAASSAPPVSYETANPLQPLRLRVRVTGSGRRRTLHWQYRAQRGVSVTFTQTGGAQAQITDTGSGRGHTRFVVAPGTAGTRHVVALVSIAGVPRQLVTVSHFTAPAPSLPRVAHASYRIRSGKLDLKWSRVHHAVAYMVSIRFAKSEITYRVSGDKTGADFGIRGRGAVRTVSLTVTAGAVTGPPVKAREPSTRPRSHRGGKHHGGSNH